MMHNITTIYYKGSELIKGYIEPIPLPWICILCILLHHLKRMIYLGIYLFIYIYPITRIKIKQIFCEVQLVKVTYHNLLSSSHPPCTILKIFKKYYIVCNRQ